MQLLARITKKNRLGNKLSTKNLLASHELILAYFVHYTNEVLRLKILIINGLFGILSFFLIKLISVWNEISTLGGYLAEIPRYHMHILACMLFLQFLQPVETSQKKWDKKP